MPGLDLGVLDRPDRGVEFGQTVLAHDDLHRPVITRVLVVDAVGLAGDGLGLIVVGWGGDGFDGFDDAAELPGEDPGPWQRLIILPGEQVPEEPLLDFRKVVVGDGDDGLGDGRQPLMRQCTGAAELQDAGHAAQHRADVAVDRRPALAHADAGADGVDVRIDVIVAGGRDRQRQVDVHDVAVAADGGHRFVALGGPPFARRGLLVSVAVVVGLVVLFGCVMVDGHVDSPGGAMLMKSGPARDR